MNMNNKSKPLIKTNYLHVRVVDIKEIDVITQLIGNEDMNTITLLQVTFCLYHLKTYMIKNQVYKPACTRG